MFPLWTGLNGLRFVQAKSPLQEPRLELELPLSIQVGLKRPVRSQKMSQQSLTDLAAKMRGIDIAILSTKTETGQIASRPMSNNGDVEYDGDSYYFTYEQARTVREIERDPEVSLAFSAPPGLLGGSSGLYVAVEGNARLIRDKA